tara:strand:+ start:420 stop:779 length:360 start_codon:yes stop_codon:yes gene_type:complete
MTNLTDIIDQMLADADAFEARATADAEVPVLSGAPWCVTTLDGALAILVTFHDDDDTITMTPKTVRPHLCGFSCMTRRDAETIAAHYPDYTVTAHKDIAALCAASLRRCVDATRAFLAG